MSTETPANTSGLAHHGAEKLTAVQIDTYNAELRDAGGFVGDRANNRAFRAILEDIRDRVSQLDEDPMGDIPSKKLSRKKLEQLLLDGDPQAAGVLLGTIEEFAQEFASVIGRFLRLKEWQDTRRIVVGGGLRASRIGELAIGRAAVVLKTAEHGVALQPIRHDPDEAGLIGCIHLAPSSDRREPRQHPGGGHRRLQNPGGRCRAQPGRGGRPLKKPRRRVRSVAPRE